MADLKMPNLNKKSDKFFFKKKLSLARKSKSKLFKESFFMLLISFIIIYLNHLIPNKYAIIKNLFSNFGVLIIKIIESLPYVFEILLAVIIFTSIVIALILFIGSLSRLVKVVKRKTSRLTFK